MVEKIILYCDGASRGNPGPASYGFVLTQNGDTIYEEGGLLGMTTNNVAEYEGLVRGLEKCRELNAEAVLVRTDSQLMVRQISGEYKVKSPHLVPLFKKAKSLLDEFAKAEVEHVRREFNKEADAMANKALDKKL